jgi:hypothetical protein
MILSGWSGLAGAPTSAWLAAIEAGEALGPVAEPPRPEGVDVGLWRRAGALARLALSVGLPLLPQEPTILLWACGLGELDATGRFLGRLAEEGPGQLSAAAFQASLPSTAGAIFSIAAEAAAPGRCASVETFAGRGAGGAALLRAETLLALGACEAVLIVGAEAPHPVLQAVGAKPLGGVAAALLFTRGGAGPRVTVDDSTPGIRPSAAFGEVGVGALIGVVALAEAGRDGAVGEVGIGGALCARVACAR